MKSTRDRRWAKSLLEAVEARSHAGHYAEALQLVEHVGQPDQGAEYQSYRLILAELKQRTGHANEAHEIAAAVVQDGAVRPSLRARAHVVLGNVCRDRGELGTAVSHFQRASMIAQQGGDVETAAWAQMRQMMTVAEISGPEIAVGLLAQTRRLVNQTGNNQITAALHLYLAEIETKRGLFDSVRRHLRTGEALLQLDPNAWLDGLAAIANLCVSFLESDLNQAIAEARKALTSSRLSGHAVTKMAATSNLGHIYLALGQYERAERWLTGALTIWPQGGGGRIAILDGLAQIALAQDNYPGCGRPCPCRRANRW